MTKQELLKMVGNEEQVDFAMELLLGSVKKPFVEMAIRSEIDDINTKLVEYRILGIVCERNGFDHVDWSMEYKPFRDAGVSAWDAPEALQEESRRIRRHCSDADALLYRRNRCVDLLAVR
jgi:hypothetical protein